MGTAAREPDAGPVGGDVTLEPASGTGSGGSGREARRPLRGARRVADVVATVVLLVVFAFESVVAGWAIVLLSLGFGSCSAPGNSCNGALGGAVVYVGPVIVAIVFAVAVAVAVLRMVRRRYAWPVPVVGITAVVAVFFACRLLADAAVTRGI